MKRESRRMIRNPILPGFNPDPSVLRVGDDYYIATSTFQWFPGVQIHHSRDLVHWRLLSRPLDRPSQLDLIGNPDSGGVWAPCLSWSGGLFYLVYTDVKSHAGAFKDTHNYVVTAPDIAGPWSEPVYLNSNGFDPSLFHDDDGRKWLVHMQWDFRKDRNPFNGIYLREYRPSERRLFGPSRLIYEGSALGLTEGPHLYKKGGFYYLMAAEGGTSYEHAVTVARSKSLAGPYETDPCAPLLTSRGKPELRLQKAGHGSLVRTQTDEWYVVHLCGRPLAADDLRCNLGRETAIQRCVWTADGWLRLADGGDEPRDDVPAPALPACPWPPAPEKDDFAGPALGSQWQSLRRPFAADWLSLTERSGWLRLKGMESPNSRFRHSLIGRRQQAFRCEAETLVDFAPQTYQQMAGLIYYYNSQNYYYLRIGRDENAGLNAAIVAADHGVYREYAEPPVPLAEGRPVHLKLTLDYGELRFYCSPDGRAWTAVGPALDAGRISDEHATHLVDGYFTDWGFTGAFIGLCAHDLTGGRLHADFDHFMYREREE